MKNPTLRSEELSVAGYDYKLKKRIKLGKPTQPLTTAFGKVINDRRSTRKFHTISKEQLSELLWHTAKVKSLQMQENGYILTYRGAPSAGARHPIDIIVYNPKIFGDAHFYYYNPFEHSVNQIADTNISPVINHVEKLIPIGNGTLIWFVAHPQRTAAKYENPESLIWRDCGALINSIQLTCTAMRLNSCPIGSLGEPYISDFFNDQDGIFGAGGLLIG